MAVHTSGIMFAPQRSSAALLGDAVSPGTDAVAADAPEAGEDTGSSGGPAKMVRTSLQICPSAANAWAPKGREGEGREEEFNQREVDCPSHSVHPFSLILFCCVRGASL